MSSDAWTGKPVIGKPLSLPRARLSAKIAENLGQSVLSRVQLLSFVYFYILKTTQLPRLLLPSSLLANFNTPSPSQKQQEDLAEPETTEGSQLIPSQEDYSPFSFLANEVGLLHRRRWQHIPPLWALLPCPNPQPGHTSAQPVRRSGASSRSTASAATHMY